jgi:hypothetical protein
LKQQRIETTAYGKNGARKKIGTKRSRIEKSPRTEMEGVSRQLDRRLPWTTGCRAGDEPDDLRTIRQAAWATDRRRRIADCDPTTSSTAYQPVVHLGRRDGTLDAGNLYAVEQVRTNIFRRRIPAVTIF